MLTINFQKFRFLANLVTHIRYKCFTIEICNQECPTIIYWLEKVKNLILHKIFSKSIFWWLLRSGLKIYCSIGNINIMYLWDMNFQMITSWCPMRTERTRIRFFASMCSLMFYKVVLVVENLIAEITYKNITAILVSLVVVLCQCLLGFIYQEMTVQHRCTLEHNIIFFIKITNLHLILW